MENRRQYPRYYETLTINYRIQKHLIEFSSRSENISEGGVCVLTSHCLDAGMQIKLLLKLSETTLPLTTRGAVVWQNEREDARFPYAIGIKFISMNKENNKKLSDHINNKLKQQAVPFLL